MYHQYYQELINKILDHQLIYFLLIWYYYTLLYLCSLNFKLLLNHKFHLIISTMIMLMFKLLLKYYIFEFNLINILYNFNYYLMMIQNCIKYFNHFIQIILFYLYLMK